MPRGGKREPKIDPETGQPKKLGRPKAARPVDGNVARKIKARIKAEEKWILVVDLATKKAVETGNTADLRHALEYLDDRDHGRPVTPVNHLHDKPLEHNVTLNLSERFRIAMEKATKRVSDLR